MVFYKREAVNRICCLHVSRIIHTHDLVAIGNHSQLNESVENSNVLIATVPGIHPEGAACVCVCGGGM